MPERQQDLLITLMAALARTWDAKLPGFRQEFSTQIDVAYMLTPATDVAARSALERLRTLLTET